MNKLKNYLIAMLLISVVSCSEGTINEEVSCSDSTAVDTTKVCCDTVVPGPGPVLDSIEIADPR